ncbi:hypothetical protein [Sandarakinorhabdus sp.]|uniref:hypothetical protein n=1 Tax=Sandarakinorhabdus sp. TaxID=1916663 RepID=UPI0035649C7F
MTETADTLEAMLGDHSQRLLAMAHEVAPDHPHIASALILHAALLGLHANSAARLETTLRTTAHLVGSLREALTRATKTNKALMNEMTDEEDLARRLRHGRIIAGLLSPQPPTKPQEGSSA